MDTRAVRAIVAARPKTIRDGGSDRQPLAGADLLLNHDCGRYCSRSEGVLSHRIEDLNAMMEVAHNRWEAACVAEDTVLAGRPDDDDDDRRYAYARALILVAHHRETVWGEYERIANLRQRTMTAC